VEKKIWPGREQGAKENQSAKRAAEKKIKKKNCFKNALK